MATLRLQQHKCPECSASLSVPPEATAIRCTYCGTTLSIENKRPPRDPSLTQPRTVYVRPPIPFVARVMMFVGPLLPIVIIGSQFWPQLRSALPVLGNQLPTECGLNGRVTIRDKTFSGSGTLIRAATNCTVVIQNSTLEGDVIVEGGVNLSVELDHAKLTARKRAIVASVNPKIRVTNKSDVRGNKSALDLGLNAEVHLEDSALHSPGIALRADGNLSLEAEGGEIEGGEAAIEASSTTRLEIDQTKITGRAPGVRSARSQKRSH